MSRKQNTHKSVYKYLETTGVLNIGSSEDIANAKKAYWKSYKATWRKQKRQQEKEFTTSWNSDEVEELTAEAKNHHMSRVAFIKKAVFAYIHTSYIVPDLQLIRKISQSLNMQHNLILEMLESETIPQKLGNHIAEKLLELEQLIIDSLNNPKNIESLVIESITKTPSLKTEIYHLLEKISTNDLEKP